MSDIRSVLGKIAEYARAIQNIPWGWDGDCGATRIAEGIEVMAELMLNAPTATPEELREALEHLLTYETDGDAHGLEWYNGLQKAIAEARAALAAHKGDR